MLKALGVGLLLLFAVIFFLARMNQDVPGPRSSGKITMAKYQALDTGISYQKAVEILGESGQEISKSELAGIKTVMYSWKNPGGSNMNAMFQNDALIQKAQFGLK